MKILILANKDVASNFAINLLLPKLSQHKTCVFLSSRVGGNKEIASPLKLLRFFEQDMFNELLSPVLPSTDKRPGGFCSFSQMDVLLESPVRELNNINSSEGLLEVSKCRPDLIISIRYGVILRDDVISIPRYGVINLHSGKLPDYRGVMATFWAMLHGEKSIATTLHYIQDSSIDTGAIIASSNLKVNKNKSYLWHVLQLYFGGINLVQDAVLSINNNESTGEVQQVGTGHYFTFPTEKDLQAFHEKGYELVKTEELIAFFTAHYL